MSKKPAYKRVSDVVPSIDFGGTEPLEDYVDKEMLIRNFLTVEGSFGETGILTVEVDGEEKVLRTSSEVVIKKLKQCMDELPLYGRVSRISSKSGREYYDIT